MTKKKKIIISAAAIAAAAVITAGSIFIWKSKSDKFKDSGKVYVSAIKDINTASTLSLNGACFSGVIESQKSYDVKYDSTKKIKEILVKEGDSVAEGAELFSYDTESMKLEQEQAELEIERMNNEISSMQKQISQLETEKKNVSKDEQYSYTAQIQSLQTDIEKTQYDIKVKNTEIDKIKNSINNSTVKSEVSGTVAKINSISDSESQDNSYNMYGGQESADVIMTITESGNFRVKGKVNEQNMRLLSEGTPVIVHSRTDDSITWNGTISEISSEPSADNSGVSYGGDSSDDLSTSSNYNFYVTPESTDGLRLGQHVIIEPDMGQSDAIEKTGIWLYSDYIVTDSDGKSYVWAADKKDRLEKRYVETGQTDDTFGDVEITDGLNESDCIAYPSDSYEEGMHTTTNADDADFEESNNDDVVDDSMIDDGMVDDGMIDDSMIDDGMVNDGMIDDGMVDDGMVDDGVVDENMVGDDSADSEADGNSGGILDGFLGKSAE